MSNDIKWNLGAKLERESKINRDKALAEANRVWDSFVRLTKKAKRMSVPVLLAKLTKMRERTIDIFKELGQPPPELMIELFDEKIALVADLKNNPNTFTHTLTGGAEVTEEFRTRAEFEALDKVKQAMGQRGFAFLLIDEANNIIAMDADEEFTTLGRVKRRSGLPYPSIAQFQDELLKKPKKK
jgi:hypothetical protein